VSVYPFIEAEKAESHKVAKACELMEVSRSAFYEWQRHRPSRRKVDDEKLGGRIAEIHKKSRGTYGCPRVHAQLRREATTSPVNGSPGSWLAVAWPGVASAVGSAPPSPTLKPRRQSI
jgi:HTH-like domain